jgi:2-iminobutanoate/2-iminopropanoate deaminase
VLQGTATGCCGEAMETTEGLDMKRRMINAANATPPAGGGYSNALEISQFERIVFVSGQIPVDINGTVPSAFAAQCRLVWANVEAQLHAAEMRLDNVVDVTTFLADRAYGMENRVIRKQVLGDLCPASTTIVADIFDAAWLIEVKVVAAA